VQKGTIRYKPASTVADAHLQCCAAPAVVLPSTSTYVLHLQCAPAAFSALTSWLQHQHPLWQLLYLPHRQQHAALTTAYHLSLSTSCILAAACTFAAASSANQLLLLPLPLLSLLLLPCHL
jgi:hypothetical protein